jgi:Flp pilus assembly protein TadG
MLFARIRNRLRRQNGQAMVEFALILPILMMVLWGAIDFGRAFWTYQQVSAAASEGARRAAVSRADANRDNTVITATRDAAPNLNADEMDVDVESDWDPGDEVTVTVTYPVEIDIIGMVILDDDLESERTARVEP